MFLNISNGLRIDFRESRCVRVLFSYEPIFPQIYNTNNQFSFQNKIYYQTFYLKFAIPTSYLLYSTKKKLLRS